MIAGAIGQRHRTRPLRVGAAYSAVLADAHGDLVDDERGDDQQHEAELECGLDDVTVELERVAVPRDEEMDDAQQRRQPRGDEEHGSRRRSASAVAASAASMIQTSTSPCDDGIPIAPTTRSAGPRST